jgi:hypothetical protein
MFTRPFEGLLLMGPVLAHLAFAALRAWPSGRRDLGAGMIAFATVIVAAAGMQAVYNHAVTGDVTSVPQIRYIEQFQQVPLFWILRPPAAKRYPDEHLRFLHVSAELEGHLMDGYDTVARKTPLLRALFLVGRFRRCLASAIPSWALLLLPTVFFARRDRLVRLLVALLMIQSLCLLAETWLAPRFLCGVVPTVLALLARSVFVVGQVFSRPGLAFSSISVLLLVPSLAWAPAFYYGPYMERISGVATNGDDSCALRFRVERQLRGLGGQHLVFLRYDFARSLMDWVYNDPIPELAPIMWARDLGPEPDRLLRTRYPKRQCWTLDARVRPTALHPCD